MVPLAIGTDAEGPSVLIAAEVLAVPESLTEAVVAGIQAKHPIPRERIALCVTHQHTGPQIAGTAPFMFSRDLPADELTRIDRYAAVLKQKLIEVARLAETIVGHPLPGSVMRGGTLRRLRQQVH